MTRGQKCDTLVPDGRGPPLDGDRINNPIKVGPNFFHTSRKTRTGFNRYIVYGWVRENIYLYIGMSTRGRARFKNHHIFSEHRRRNTDEAHVWICKDGAECIELEKILIRIHTPLLNRDHNPEYRRNRARSNWLDEGVKIIKPRNKRIYKPRRNRIFVPDKVVKSAKLVIPAHGLSVTNIRKLIKRPKPEPRVFDISGLTRLEALTQCKNQAEYNFVMRLINQGAL